MKKTIAIAILAAGTFAAPVLAQDTESKSGFYAGALVGYDSVRLSDGTDSESKGDVVYGGVLGYDFDLGQAVLGVEAELSDSGVSVSETDVVATGDSLTLSADRDIYVGIRAGAKVGSNVLLYAKGGYVNGRIKAHYQSGATVVNDGQNMDGFRLGAGLEYSFGKFALRGEYRYSDYGQVNWSGFATGISATRHQGVVTALVKF